MTLLFFAVLESMLRYKCNRLEDASENAAFDSPQLIIRVKRNSAETPYHSNFSRHRSRSNSLSNIAGPSSRIRLRRIYRSFGSIIAFSARII